MFRTNGGGYIVNEDGSLSPLSESKLLDTNNGIATKLLIHPEGIARVESRSEKMPNVVEWGDFYAEEAYQNVGYAFKLESSSPLDVDLDALRMQKVLAGEIDEDDEMECTGAYMPVYVCIKYFLLVCPKLVTYSTFLLKFTLTKNSREMVMPSSMGRDNKYLTCIFLIESLGQVSAIFENEEIRGLGII